jgi:hypothetical protein
MLRREVRYKFTDVSDLLTASIIRTTNDTPEVIFKVVAVKIRNLSCEDDYNWLKGIILN